MKIKNLTIGSLFVICIACGGSGEAPNYPELGSAQQELEKCYQELPVEACNNIVGKHQMTGKALVAPKTPCEDVSMAVQIACVTKMYKQKLETMAEMMKDLEKCSGNYRPNIEKACGKSGEPFKPYQPADNSSHDTHVHGSEHTVGIH